MINDENLLNTIDKTINSKTPRRTPLFKEYRHAGKEDHGYIEDNNGNLVRVVEYLKDEADIGPGSYSPNDPNAISHYVTISKDKYLRWPIVTDPFPCGPADFAHKPKETRLQHTISDYTEPPPPDPPLSGDLPPNDWSKKKEIRIPKHTHPLFDFTPMEGTSSFESKATRDLWENETRYRAPPPTVHAPNRDLVKEFSELSSGVFLSKSDRFKLPPSDTPGPAAYNIPDNFGKTTTRVFYPPSEKYVKYDIMPEPGQYSPDVVQKVKTKESSFSKVKRFDKIERTPGPGQYETSIKSTRRPGTTIQVTRDKRTSWATKSDTPCCTQYDAQKPRRTKGGYISTLAHRDLGWKTEDHPLEFRTQHSSFIKPSFNAHYAHVNRRYRR